MNNQINGNIKLLKPRGTYEWVKRTANIYKGCLNNCTYCYSKVIFHRFGIKDKNDWSNMELNEKVMKIKIRKTYRKGIMFPSSHDIFPDTVKTCYKYLVDNILESSNNNLLIVSKPNFESINYLCNGLMPYQYRIEFRFTITTRFDYIRETYEPQAPSIEERILCLKYALMKGYKTSVSIEPFLDQDPFPLILKLEPYSSSIWIGCDSTRNMEIHSQQNLCDLIGKIKRLDKKMIYKIHLKNSFRDKIKGSIKFWIKKIEGNY